MSFGREIVSFNVSTADSSFLTYLRGRSMSALDIEPEVSSEVFFDASVGDLLSLPFGRFPYFR